MQTGETKTAGLLVWVSGIKAGSRELVETTAREFKLAVRFCGYGDLLDVIRSERSPLVAIEMDSSPGQALTLLKQVHERFPRVTILAASSDSGVAMIGATLEAGANDLLSLPLDSRELHKALIKFTQVDTKPAAARTAMGEVVTLCGARGGLGVTTLAVNLAIRLGTLMGAEVALVDLDLQRGDVAAFLNLTPSQSLATVAAAGEDLDTEFLRGTLTRHSSGTFVLPAPVQVEEAETIGHAEIDRAIGLLRAQFRYTVVDTSRTITGATLAAFEQSDHILLLTDLSVPSVRAVQRICELMTRLGIPAERVEMLVTNAVPGPVALAEAMRAIGKQPLLTIPRDSVAAAAAMNAGTPLNGTRPSRLTQAIDQLAAQVAGTGGVSRSKRGPLLQRLFSRGVRV